MKQLLILMLVSVLFVPMVGSAKADEVLYCQSELATGMKKENGTWRTGTFTKDRYTIKFSSDYKKMKLLDNDYSCHNFSETEVKNRYICRSSEVDTGNSFIFDSQSKRFVYSVTNIFTYLEDDTPTIRAGTCEKF